MKIERTFQTIAFLDLDIGSPFWAHGRLWVRTDGDSATELKSSPDLNVERFNRDRASSCNFLIDGTVRPVEGPYGFPNNDLCELVEAVKITVETEEKKS